MVDASRASAISADGVKPSLELADCIRQNVAVALAEDVRDGDLTAALIDNNDLCTAHVITREAGVLAGQAWFDEVFYQLDNGICVEWQLDDGAVMAPGQVLCTLEGLQRELLTGERTALNFVQTLSGTATAAAEYVRAVSGTNATILDTRKTIPGLRNAQKYAVTCGGAQNHRVGLYDGILIKENHIIAAGSIRAAVRRAKEMTAGADIKVEVEVEDFVQLEEALNAHADIVMLDNFELSDLGRAVAVTQGRAKLEASGGISLASIRAIAETGVDYISVGRLTKHVQAIDLSMRFSESQH